MNFYPNFHFKIADFKGAFISLKISPCNILTHISEYVFSLNMKTGTTEVEIGREV
jgi:hypothetical protein